MEIWKNGLMRDLDRDRDRDRDRGRFKGDNKMSLEFLTSSNRIR